MVAAEQVRFSAERAELYRYISSFRYLKVTGGGGGGGDKIITTEKITQFVYVICISAYLVEVGNPSDWLLLLSSVDDFVKVLLRYRKLIRCVILFIHYKLVSMILRLLSLQVDVMIKITYLATL